MQGLVLEAIFWTMERLIGLVLASSRGDIWKMERRTELMMAWCRDRLWNMRRRVDLVMSLSERHFVDPVAV